MNRLHLYTKNSYGVLTAHVDWEDMTATLIHDHWNKAFSRMRKVYEKRKLYRDELGRYYIHYNRQIWKEC